MMGCRYREIVTCEQETWYRVTRVVFCNYKVMRCLVKGLYSVSIKPYLTCKRCPLRPLLTPF